MDIHQSLLPDCYYHIYNRGINGEDVFKERESYFFFLKRYASFLFPVVDTFAYCLLKNHFHLLIRVKPQEDLTAFLDKKTPKPHSKSSGLHSPDFIVSKQFANFFSSYSQAVNKRFHRTGSLFETPFHRIQIEEESYFTRLIWYIHFNPQKHNFVRNFSDYPYSSYKSHLSNYPTKLMRREVLDWFGNSREYVRFHQQMYNDESLSKLIIEKD